MMKKRLEQIPNLAERVNVPDNQRGAGEMMTKSGLSCTLY